VRFEEEDVLAQRIRDAIIQPVKDQVPVKICLSGPIVTQDKDKDMSEDNNGNKSESKDGGNSRFEIAAGILSTLVLMGIGQLSANKCTIVATIMGLVSLHTPS
jgi:hypothetical protein